MAGRALSSFTLLALLTAASSVARAEDPQQIAVGEPSPQREAADAPSAPKLLGAGKGEDGTHAFLFGRREASPVVFLGQPGQLQQLEVLGIERYPGVFVVDTLELGTIKFDTARGSVIIPGDVGFIQKRPTRVMSKTPDRVALAEALGRMGYVRKAPTPAQAITGAAARVVAKGKQMTSTGGDHRLGIFSSAKGRGQVTAKARSMRRPTAKLKQKARVRATARPTIH